jgi:SH3-like domain-containing protein
MRPSVPIFLAWALFLAAGVHTAAAQTSPPSGTLQPKAAPAHDQPMKPPAGAPRQPVHKEAGPVKTPVVPPHGPTHPNKPATVTAKPALPAAPKPITPKPTTPKPAPPSAMTPPAGSATLPAEAKAPPEKLPDPEKPEGGPLKLPRFASLRSDEVNMRAGPGTRYRIDWVYKRRDLPVEIEREFDVWRWVRDADGIQGWVHQATLMGRRNFIIQKADATLRSEAREAGAAVAVLKPGVIGRIRSCEAASNWCNVQTGSYRGYLQRDQFWGLLPNEVIAP